MAADLRFTYHARTTSAHDGLFMAHTGTCTFAAIDVTHAPDNETAWRMVAGHVRVPHWLALAHPVSPADLRALGEMNAALYVHGYELDAHHNIVDRLDGFPLWLYREMHAAWLGAVAYCLWRYGAKDVVRTIHGNNRKALWREARAAL